MAEPTAQATEELELSAGDKKLRIRGSDILGMINMAAIGIMLVGGFDHVQAARDGQKETVQAIREANKTNQQLVQAMQEANCLSRLTPEQKKSATELAWCAKIGQGRAF